MKKALIYVLTATSLLAASCARVDLVEPGVTDYDGDGAAISLQVKSANTPMTRATKPGDDDGDFNENKVYTVDYFIFDVDPSTNVNVAPVTKGRFDFEGVEPVTEELAKQYGKIVPLEEWFNENKNECWAYVIANLPDKTASPKNYFEVNADGDLQQVVVGTTTTTTVFTLANSTYSALQAIEIVTAFKESVDDGGKFKAQKSFVMSGLSGKITLEGHGAKDVIVPIKRLAAKVSLTTNVAKMVDKHTYNSATGKYEYGGTYFPNIDYISVYLNYVNPEGELSGAYGEYSDGVYFTYPRDMYDPSIDPDSSFTSKVIKKDPNTGEIVVDDDGNVVFEDSKPFPSFEVTGTPFYSYPTTWDTRDTKAPFVKVIIPWVEYWIGEKTVRDQYTTELSHTIDIDPENETYQDIVSKVLDGATQFPESITVSVNGTDYTINRRTPLPGSTASTKNGKEFYYKISLPAFLNGSTTTCALEMNKWYMVNVDISVLGSESDDAAMIIDGSQLGIYVCDWAQPTEAIGGDMDGGRYLSTAQKEYVIDGINSIDIPVISSHNIKATITEKRVWVKGSWATSWTSSTGTHNLTNRGTVSASGSTSITLTNNLNTAVDGNLDCYPFRFKVRIYQVDGNGNEESGSLETFVTVIQYPSIYIDQKNGGNVMIDGFYGNVNNHYHSNTGGTPYGDSGTNTGTVTNTPYAPISNYVDRQQTMTVISVSSLSANPTYTIPGRGTYDYRIADPRQNSGFHANDLARHYRGDYNQTNADSRLISWTEPEASGVKVGNMTTGNYIAPKIMISSRWGRMGNWQPHNDNATRRAEDRFELVQKRCATYQEAGYPAGRWRLPTEAEIMFIANLQEYDFIDALFTYSGPSISAEGSVFRVPDGNQTFAYYPYNPNETDEYRGGKSCRCVYDLWYWGEDPVANVSTYTIAVQ